MTVQKAGAAAALPLLLNPATVGVVAIGAVGWGLFQLLRDDEEDATEAVIAEPKAIRPAFKIEAVKAEPNGLQVSLEEKECHTEARGAASEAEQREIVRQAMSELGKPSPVARARRKAAASERVVIGGE